MTRLRKEDIENISAQLKDYGRELVKKTGRTLLGIGCYALDLDEEKLLPLALGVSVAVVPVDSGQGVISKFSLTVRDIVEHIGLKAFVTEAPDVSGITEAVEKGAQIIMMADDMRFVALCLKTASIVDNSKATAIGYIAGLDLMCGGIKNQKILILGCGPVGRNAVIAALQRGAEVSVFDIDIQRSQNLATDMKQLTGKPITIKDSIGGGYISPKGYNLIVDATNAAGLIHKDDITLKTFIAAPGMPLGLLPSAAGEVSGRLLHDPLQLGVAVMAIEAVKRLQT